MKSTEEPCAQNYLLVFCTNFPLFFSFFIPFTLSKECPSHFGSESKDKCEVNSIITREMTRSLQDCIREIKGISGVLLCS